MIMAINRMQALIFVGIGILLSSCCTPGTRPQDANFIQAFCGVSSGQFERQLERDRNQAATSRQKLDIEQFRSQNLQTDLVNKKVEHDALLQELAEMENTNQQIYTQITKMQADSEKAKHERTRLHAKLTTIKQQVDALKHKASIEQDAVRQHRSEVSRLKQEIETLRMIISVQ